MMLIMMMKKNEFKSEKKINPIVNEKKNSRVLEVSFWIDVSVLFNNGGFSVSWVCWGSNSDGE